jgi:hypothetical protein
MPCPLRPVLAVGLHVDPVNDFGMTNDAGFVERLNILYECVPLGNTLGWFPCPGSGRSLQLAIQWPWAVDLETLL